MATGAGGRQYGHGEWSQDGQRATGKGAHSQKWGCCGLAQIFSTTFFIYKIFLILFTGLLQSVLQRYLCDFPAVHCIFFEEEKHSN